jgi:outer membrane protein TolC
VSPNKTIAVRLRAGWCLAAVWFAVTGCSHLRHSAAVDPYRYAPPSASETWKGSPEALPLSEGTHTNLPVSISESNAALLHPLPGAELAGRLEKTNDLPDLIDLAQRSNPQTRVAWEQARAAAAQLGLADSAYLPVLAFVATAGYEYSVYPAPGGLLVASGPNFNPGATLQWTLLDFGRRRATFDAAQQDLLRANFQFNRTHQQVAYDVQRSFYGYDSSRSRLHAAEATLKTAQTVLEASSLRLTNGLGTKSDFLQARQEFARAQFELQSAQRGLSDAWALLAESLGVSPTVVFSVAELSELPMPTNLVESVEVTIDRALRQRPDLAAQLAVLRSREAEIRRAQSAYLPSIALSGSGGGTMGRWDATSPGSTAGPYGYADGQYSAFLTFSWTLFDGFARKNRLRESEARRDAARAELTALELKTLREVWKAYADVKASFLQYDYARALIAASEDAYDAALTAYKNGLGTIVQLLTAERDLARARTTLIESRAEVLTTSATLAFATGDWGGSKIAHSPAAKKQ